MNSRYAGVMVIWTALSLGVCAAQPIDASEASVENEIRTLENQEVAAVLTHDAATLERLWDKSYVVHNPEGRIVPAGATVTARPVFQNTRASFVRDVESIVVNGDVVFSMGSESVTSSAEPPAVGHVTRRRYTNVWMRRDGTWKLVARHANKICGEE